MKEFQDLLLQLTDSLIKYDENTFTFCYENFCLFDAINDIVMSYRKCIRTLDNKTNENNNIDDFDKYLMRNQLSNDNEYAAVLSDKDFYYINKADLSNKNFVGNKLHITIDSNHSDNFIKGCNIVINCLMKHNVSSFKIIKDAEHMRLTETQTGKQITVYMCLDEQLDWPSIINNLNDRLVEANIIPSIRAPFELPLQSQFLSFRNDRNSETGDYISADDYLEKICHNYLIEYCQSFFSYPNNIDDCLKEIFDLIIKNQKENMKSAIAVDDVEATKLDEENRTLIKSVLENLKNTNKPVYDRIIDESFLNSLVGNINND